MPSAHLQRRDGAGVRLQDGDRRRRADAPDAHALVVAAGRQQAVVVADRDVADLGGVTPQGRQQAAGLRAPDLHQVVVGALRTVCGAESVVYAVSVRCTGSNRRLLIIFTSRYVLLYNYCLEY